MLQELGRYLRCCGIDTAILNNSDDHSKAIQISHAEDRVILTRGKSFFMLHGHVSEGMCMWVPDGTLKEQMQMIFARYNISMKTRDIFSRCKLCNSDQYICITSSELKLAYTIKNYSDNLDMLVKQYS